MAPTAEQASGLTLHCTGRHRRVWFSESGWFAWQVAPVSFGVRPRAGMLFVAECKENCAMFTIFDMLQLCGGLGGLVLGVYWGGSHFGIIGGILGAFVGGCVGYFCGWLPWAISWRLFSRKLQGKSSGQIRQELRGERYYIFHLFLVELMARGEDIQGEVGSILSLLRSEHSDKRHFGWQCLQIAYPDMARQISDYDPYSSVEACRTQADAIAHAA